MGFNTPSVIRWPAEAAARSSGPHARFVRINMQHPEVPEDLEASGRAVGIEMDAQEALRAVCRE